VGRVGLLTHELLPAALNQRVGCIRLIDPNQLSLKYLYHILNIDAFEADCINASSGVAQKNLSTVWLKKCKIPLPPLEIQEQIVAELDGYQRIIDGARQIAANWKPRIDIDPEWEKTEIEDLCTLVRGSSPRPKGDKRYYGGNVPRLLVSDVTRDGMYVTPITDYLTEDGAKLSRPMKKGEVVMAVSGNPGLPSILSIDACIHDGFVGFRKLSTKIIPEYFYYVLLYQKETNNLLSVGAVFKNLTTDQIKKFRIPLPSLETQEKIVEKIEAERALVESTEKLSEIYEQKIKDTVAKLWNN
jgi:restriction endonuclease S subunit